MGAGTLCNECSRGQFVPPTLIEIDSIDQVEEEIFGPVLHILRWKAGELDRLIENINALGYGLTLGIQSRIDETVNRIASRARVGNLYVNRNMVGAVVGTQPFGGESRSGTGPKAGGPLYLYRLVQGMPALPANLIAPTVPAAFLEFERWIESGPKGLDVAHLSRLRAAAKIYRSRQVVGNRLSLPGPTGEENTLVFLPRNRVMIRPLTPVGFFNQLLAVLACEALAVFSKNTLIESWLSALPQAVRPFLIQSDEPHQRTYSAVLFEGSVTDAQNLAAECARQEGERVRVQHQIEATPYDVLGLLVERCLTINTAAAGGNAALASLEG
jgi:RHH-type proline utilization regulon transcriptional repressor/proline dehydrogenase/delta 1-pyrroline-5-carboxylate dehydrogenase